MGLPRLGGLRRSRTGRRHSGATRRRVIAGGGGCARSMASSLEPIAWIAAIRAGSIDEISGTSNSGHPHHELVRQRSRGRPAP